MTGNKMSIGTVLLSVYRHCAVSVYRHCVVLCLPALCCLSIGTVLLSTSTVLFVCRHCAVLCLEWSRLTVMIVTLPRWDQCDLR